MKQFVMEIMITCTQYLMTMCKALLTMVGYRDKQTYVIADVFSSWSDSFKLLHSVFVHGLFCLLVQSKAL